MKEFKSKRLRVWENINRTMQEFKVLLLGYRSYTALLTQSGTDAPVATVLENTLSEDLVWVRNGVGNYSCTSVSNIFTQNKTFLFVNTDGNTAGGIITTFGWGNVNDVLLFHFGETSITPPFINFVELNSGSNNVGLYVEIRVYN